MKSIAVVSVARSDYGILRPILRAIVGSQNLKLQLIVAGTHLSKEFGRTAEEIAHDGFAVAASFDTAPDSDDPAGIAQALSRGVAGCADAYARLRPDIVLLVGDRYEMMAAAVSALPFTLPIAHVHGGELTEGAIDNQIRHAITKCSHLHFVSTRRHAERVMQMGEEPWRVTVSGAPALDNLRTVTWLERQALESLVGIELAPPPLVVTYHPVTLEYGDAAWQADELCRALDGYPGPIVVTAPNADTAHLTVGGRLKAWALARKATAFVDSLGTDAYWSLLRLSAAMVGNSSSGIIESASLKVPVVNVGMRQAGREQPPNVIQTDNRSANIASGLARAVNPSFRATLGNLVNPYGDSHAAERIVRVLQETPLDTRLLVKRFHDVHAVHPAPVEN